MVFEHRVLYIVLAVIAFPATVRAGGASPTHEAKRSEPSEGARHLIGVAAEGFAYYGIDRALSPRAYRGMNWGGALFYEYRGEKNLHDVTLREGLGSPKTRTDIYMADLDADGNPMIEKVDPFQVQGELQYAYHRLLLRRNTVDVGLGCALDAYIDYLSAAGFTWLAAYSLNPSILTNWRPRPRHMLRVRVYSPLLTALSRPTWTIFNDAVLDRPPWTNLFVAKVTSVYQFARVAAEVTYEWAVSEHVRFALIYEISYIHTTVPRRADILCSNLSLGVVPNFSGRHR